MSKRKPDVYLQDVLESIKQIDEYLDNVRELCKTVLLLNICVIEILKSSHMVNMLRFQNFSSRRRSGLTKSPGFSKPSVNENEFYQNPEKQDAVLRRLEIMGEAVKHISEEIRDKYDDVPWRRIAGMRDIIIHEYFGITLSMVWVVAKRDLPNLKSRIERIIKDNP